MKRIVAILVALLMGGAVTAQVNVELVGSSANAAGKRIALYCYEDMLSQTEQLLAEEVVDSTGAFRLSCYITYPRLVYVEIETYSQSFYVEPGRRYEVYIPRFDWDINERQNVYLAPVALPLEFMNLPPDELNLQIMAMEEVIDSVMDTNRVWFDFRFHRQKRYFDTLVAAVNARVPDGDNTFMNRYKEYTLARLQLALGFATRAQLARRFINDQPVLYHDENYMLLLFDLYADFISQGMRKVPLWKLTEWVEQGNLAAYIDSVGTEPLLYDEQLRELAVLVALKESYYDARYDREGVLRMMEKLGAQTKFPEHKRLAEKLSGKWKTESGKLESAAVSTFHFPLSAIELPDVDGNRVNLDSLRGNWVYLSFVRVNDAPCQREIETLAHFRDSVYSRYPNVRFVSISCDREFQKMYHFLRNSKRGARYNWLWLHFDGDYRMLERLGVVSYPTFILIDPEGRRPYELAPSPESGFLLMAPWMKEQHNE